MSELRLPEGDVHVWWALLGCDSARPERLEVLLSDDEQARAARFVFARDRHHFISARGILRTILGHYLQQPASSVEFTYEPEGKPRLRRTGSAPPLRFNISHSHGLAAFAFSCDREIGVDVEAIRIDINGDELAARFFSAKEIAELRSLPGDTRAEGFFLCWTRKEAYVKALGLGLGIPLDSFDVSLTPGKPETLTSTDSSRWMLRSFRPSNGYAGAVVAEGNDWNLHLLDWASANP
jgi:4'-phosphopantetheinyl transferase